MVAVAWQIMNETGTVAALTGATGGVVGGVGGVTARDGPHSSQAHNVSQEDVDELLCLIRTP